MNQVILVGRLAEEPEIVTTNNGTKRSVITLAINRSFKNSEGIYETDFIYCVLWNNVAEKNFEYCHKGDVIGVKGRLQTKRYEDKEFMEVIAEKISFLSQAKKEVEAND